MPVEIEDAPDLTPLLDLLERMTKSLESDATSMHMVVTLAEVSVEVRVAGIQLYRQVRKL